MAHIQFNEIFKEYAAGPTERTGLRGFTLTVPSDEIQVWLGPSGSGKSTAARILAGLESQDSGEVYLDGHALGSEEPHVRARKRGIYYVFQNPNLYPHLTVGENILFGAKANARVLPDAETFFDFLFRGLFPDILDADRRRMFLQKRPNQLSGGECQRVAIAKALVRGASITVFDEPLSSVDAPLRTAIRRFLKTWLKSRKITTIWITHDQFEAVAVADSIAVINRGRILQYGTIDELIGLPKYRTVATFIAAGLGNPLSFLRGTLAPVEGGAFDFISESTRFRDVHVFQPRHVPRGVVCGVPADSVHVVVETINHSIVAKVEATERHADGHIVICQLHGQQLIARANGASIPHVGDHVRLQIKGRYLLFDEDSGDTVGRGTIDISKSSAKLME